MAEMFAVDVRTISEHLQNIFKSGELGEKSVIRKIRTTAADGVLKVILSVKRLGENYE